MNEAPHERMLDLAIGPDPSISDIEQCQERARAAFYNEVIDNAVWNRARGGTDDLVCHKTGFEVFEEIGNGVVTYTVGDFSTVRWIDEP